MRRIFTTSLLIVLLSFMATAKAPKWAVKKPAAENDTYRYVVESASANDVTNAENKALGRVYQNAIMSLGLTVSVSQVNDAIRTGDFESMAVEFKIPVLKVCSYIEKLSKGGVRVYVLCQVGVKSDRIQKPQYTEFRNCGSKGDTDVEISGRPDEWARYEGSEYSAAFLEKELAKDENDVEERKTLLADVRNNLINNLNIRQDDEVTGLIYTNDYFNKQKRTIYVVAYVAMDNVTHVYNTKVTGGIETCNRMREIVQSYINEGNINSAKAYIDKINGKIDNDIDPYLNFLVAYSSGSIDHLQRDISSLKSTIDEMNLGLQGKAEKNRENKIKEFVRSAEIALKERKVGDALRYYYAAQMLLKDIPDGANMTLKSDETNDYENANIFINKKIKSILNDVNISFDGFISKTEAKLGFLYKGEAVTNIDYKYNDNNGWSHTQSVKDGWTIIQLSPNNRPKSINVKLEYQYKDEASFDPEVANAIKKHKFNYDKEAQHIIEVKESAIEKTTQQAVSAKASTAMNQNIVADRTVEKKHTVSEADSIKYMAIISEVCKAINSKNYKSIYHLFSSNGCKQLDTLLNYGKAYVISSSFCRFIRIGDEIMCRSIPMQFTFSKGRRTQENVVFTFDSLGMIDGIQFALEERSARNIMADKKYSETTKLALINFMENYKTAFAMKRLDYINSIFADDAVIIVGRVLHKTNMVDLGQKRINDEIEYARFSKGEYLVRLARQFESKEWINLKFSNTKFRKSAQGEIYSIQLLQDYSSDNYGDHGYLFLLIDCSNPDQPKIKVRTWQPESAGEPFSMADYEELINKK